MAYFGNIIEVTRRKCPVFPGFNQHFPGYPVVPRDFPWFLRIPCISCVLPWFSILSWDFPCYPGISHAFPGCLTRIFYAFPGFLMLSRDFPCLPGFPMLSRDFPCFPRIFQVFWGIIPRPLFFPFGPFIRCLLFGGNACSFALVREVSCGGEKNIIHAAQPWTYIWSFSKSFWLPLNRKPLALEL